MGKREPQRGPRLGYFIESTSKESYFTKTLCLAPANCKQEQIEERPGFISWLDTDDDNRQ
jgi:hypothetical protein